MLLDMGVVKSNGMGTMGFDWVDIKAYLDLMGIEMEIGDVKLLKKLSEDYAAQLSVSKNPMTIAPYSDDNERKTNINFLFDAM